MGSNNTKNNDKIKHKAIHEVHCAACYDDICGSRSRRCAVSFMLQLLSYSVAKRRKLGPADHFSVVKDNTG
jgi:hypothetical protein